MLFRSLEMINLFMFDLGFGSLRKLFVSLLKGLDAVENSLKGWNSMSFGKLLVRPSHIQKTNEKRCFQSKRSFQTIDCWSEECHLCCVISDERFHFPSMFQMTIVEMLIAASLSVVFSSTGLLSL